jgi:hypothetical protein
MPLANRPVMSRRLASLVALAMVCVASLSGCAVRVGDDGEVPATTDEGLAEKKVSAVTTISYAPNSYVIGNAYPGWTDDVQGDPQFSSGPGNPDGVWYRWGFLFGESFDRCAWIGNTDAGDPVDEPGSACASPQQIDTPYFLATYTDGIHNELAGDGSVTHMHYSGSGCSDTSGYGNVEPWKEPATPHNSLGPIPDGTELIWRYVSKDGDWVLVRDPSGGSATTPNWFFVHRGCVSLANED